MHLCDACHLCIQKGTLSGLTASLLTSITKLAHYLKESEVQLKGEVAWRDQRLNTMNDQQNLREALTTDLVKLQEQNCGLSRDLNDLRESTQQQIRKQQKPLLQCHLPGGMPKATQVFLWSLKQLVTLITTLTRAHILVTQSKL